LFVRPHEKVIVVGASGVVGQAVARQFSSQANWETVAVSRRPPVNVGPVTYVSLNLRDRDSCARCFERLADVTHLVYAAAYESKGLVDGWSDREQMQINLDMLRNVIDPLDHQGSSLRHITLMQGGKAYGIHLDPFMKVPAKESWPRHPHENFYWLQEDLLRERQPNSGWNWTVLRPRLVFGDGLGSNMNPLPALGAYAAMLRERDLPLAFPGGPSRVYQAVDADLLGRACVWAATSSEARNEIFNVTNGDEFVWRTIWPILADAFGMEVGDDCPEMLSQTMPDRSNEWARIVDKYKLASPANLDEFVGQGFAYLDFQLATNQLKELPPSLVSTIKIRQAGFADCLDTEEMLRKWLRRYQDMRWLPA
jgi:nucleoside-diphosphate-sugar epimerase